MKRRDFFSTAGAATAAAVLTRSRSTAAPNGGQGGTGPVGDQPKAQNIHQKVLAERSGSLKGLPEPYKLPKLTSKDLTEYVPSTEMPWDKQRAGYLLRRTMFGNNIDQNKQVRQMTPSEAVDALLSDDPAPTLPANWINENYVYTADNTRDANRFREFTEWWIDLMVTQNLSIREKMVLFWHDHWATERSSVRQPQFNYWFIDMFRQNPLGNFKQMVKDVTVAPCMLVYLDGWYNTKQRPNENYARELMELHTLGEGIGYTEQDIVAASNALTGWTLQNYGGTGRDYEYDPKDAIFIQSRYDDADKTFMGRTGNWGALDIVDIIFEERASEVAHFICRKLYREFVYEIVDEDIIDQLADLFIQSNWEIKPVLAKLLKSEHFFDSINFGAHITSPFEHFVGAIRTFDVKDVNYSYVHNACALMGFQLLAAPNVKGWPAYRTWISASRLASRWDYSDRLVASTTSGKFGIDLIGFSSQFEDWDSDAYYFLDQVIEHVIELELSESQYDIMFQALLSGHTADYWGGIPESSRPGLIQEFLQTLLRTGEYQII